METNLMVRESMELSIDEVRGQVDKIQLLMKDLMKEGEHFGVIPGCDKPTLFKAGAEKLGFTFRLVPEFQITRNDIENGHREYEVLCTLKHMQTGQTVGQGVGNCSTMESKYRYRNEWTDTGRPVPNDYWKNKDTSLLGGKQFSVKKIDGTWCVAEKNKIENPDIADTYNTVLKMAKKRAHVDAMITACAASDIFTQDVEDTADQKQDITVKGSPDKKHEEKIEAPEENLKLGRELYLKIAGAVASEDLQKGEAAIWQQDVKAALQDIVKLKKVAEALSYRLEQCKSSASSPQQGDT